MTRRRLRVTVGLAVTLVAVGVVWWLRSDRRPPHYTGFVEGEERVLRSEVTGRVLTVTVREGDAVAADAVVARLDDADVRSRLDAKRRELDMIEADMGRQDEQVALLEQTWRRDVNARQAELREAEAAAAVAERTFVREQQLEIGRASCRERG